MATTIVCEVSRGGMLTKSEIKKMLTCKGGVFLDLRTGSNRIIIAKPSSNRRFYIISGHPNKGTLRYSNSTMQELLKVLNQAPAKMVVATLRKWNDSRATGLPISDWQEARTRVNWPTEG